MSGAYNHVTASELSKDVCFKSQMKVKVLALDFDKTCTTKAILDIYKARQDYPIHKNSLDEKWEEILKFYNSIMAPILKPLADLKPMPGEFDEDGLRKFLAQVSTGDNQAIDELISSKLLQQITPKGLLDFAQNVELMPGVLAVLENLKSLHLPLHVISLNFSEKLIRYVLNQEGTLPFKIHTNKLQFENNISNGNMDKQFISAFDKEICLQNIIDNAENTGVTIYIGDSFTDLLALLKADIGIIIGKSKSMFTVCNNFGIHIIPLHKWSFEQFTNEEKKVLFSVDNWNEIQTFIFNNLKCDK